jgi:hypothetical protein
MRKVIHCVCLAAVVVATSMSCGDVVRNSRAPVILVINSLQAAQGNKPSLFFSNLLSDVIVNVTTPAPCSTTSPCPTIFNDLGQATLTLVMKDASIQPSTNNSVTITRYHVEFTRADGRNRPGADVPYGFDGAVTATVLPNAQTVFGFEWVRTSMKVESPLVQLINSAVTISTIATVTFYGRDQVGNDISISGSISIDFGDFGDS